MPDVAASPQRAEYCSALVSMPYFDGQGQPSGLTTAPFLAGCLGWSCSRHDEWGWYLPGETALVLFKRRSPAADMRRAWVGSFKRWLIVNRTRLEHLASRSKRLAIDDLITCHHLPIELKNFDDLRERYVREFVSDHYWSPDDAGVQDIQALMAQWADESQERAPA